MENPDLFKIYKEGNQDPSKLSSDELTRYMSLGGGIFAGVHPRCWFCVSTSFIREHPNPFRPPNSLRMRFSPPSDLAYVWILITKDQDFVKDRWAPDQCRTLPLELPTRARFGSESIALPVISIQDCLPARRNKKSAER